TTILIGIVIARHSPRPLAGNPSSKRQEPMDPRQWHSGMTRDASLSFGFLRLGLGPTAFGWRGGRTSRRRFLFRAGRWRCTFGAFLHFALLDDLRFGRRHSCGGGLRYRR